jgi:hypothetical protein
MSTFLEKIESFRKLSKIAVTGVSSSRPDAANLIFRKLRDTGISVQPVNPRVTEVEGTICYPDLTSIPIVPEAVVIASPPQTARLIIDECLRLNIKHVWLHSSINKGSFDQDAVKYAEEHGISVIPTGCPLMYYPPVDFGHRCMKWIFNLTGKIPAK